MGHTFNSYLEEISLLAGLSLLDDGFPSDGRYFPVQCCKQPGWGGSGSGGGCWPSNKPGATWELLCAAAAEVERIKFEALGPSGKPGPAFSGPFNHSSVPYDLFQRLREQQIWKQRRQGGVWGGASDIGSGGSRLTYHQFGSGIRVVHPFPSNRKCAGTGVFLPRRVGSSVTSEPTRKKSGGSTPTVVIPARVVHALNLNLNEFSGAQPRFTSDADTALKLRSGDVLGPPQKRSSKAQPGMVGNAEIVLPQEWTY